MRVLHYLKFDFEQETTTVIDTADRMLYHSDMKSSEKINQKYNVRPFKQAPLTKEKIDFLVLKAIDLSKYKEEDEGLDSRKLLADQLEKCVTTYGFFYIENYGVAENELNHLRALGQSIFEIPDEIKQKHKAGDDLVGETEIGKNLGIVRGSGYKPRGHWILQNGVPDEVEHYNFRNMLHNDLFENRNYPDLIRAYLDDVAKYYRHLHFNVVRKLCNLCDLILEIPEGTLWEKDFKVIQNDLRNSGGGFGRFMIHHKMSDENSMRSGGARLKGHSDASGFTLITSQPIASLQIWDGSEWRYVAHRENTLIVNIGDAMKYITGEYFISSIHRVVAPPKDQEDFQRLNIIYFCDPSLNTYLDPRHLNSLKLLRLNKIPAGSSFTFEEWDEEKGKLLNIGNSQKDKPTEILGRPSIIQLDTGGDPSLIEAKTV